MPLRSNINLPPNYIDKINKIALDKYKNISQDAKRQIVSYLDKMFSIQFGKEKELTEIGKQIIYDNYENILDNVILDIKIVKPFDSELLSMANKTKSEKKPKSTEQTEKKKTPNIKKEVDKRNLLNNIIQGESQNIISLINFEKSKINSLHPELLDIYKNVFHINKTIEWTEDVDLAMSMEQAPEFSNMVEILWDEKTGNPIIKVRALDLPMLIHETVKGIYELIIMKDPAFDEEDIKEIISQTDTLEAEQEDIKYGPYIAQDIRTYIQNVINKNSKASSIKNIIEFIYAKIVEMPIDDFNYLIIGILNNESQYESVINEFIDEIIDEFEKYNIDQVQTTFDTQEDKFTKVIQSKELSDDEIYKMIDVALDRGDYKEAERLSKKLKKNLKEGFSDYLKPKSQEEIRKSLGNSTPEQKLFQGAKHGILWLVQEALDEGVDPSADNNLAIRWASRTGHLELVKLLLSDKRVDPSADNNLAIQWASGYGHLEVVKLLLSDKRVDPSANNNYAIRLASEIGYLEVVKLLLSDKRVDPSANNNYAIRLASENGYLEVVKLLLSDKRVDPSANNNLAIQWASRKDHLEVVKLLLSDKRVRDSLDGRDLEKYQRQISTLKEGFSDYLKPKSQEEINKDLSSLLPNKKLRVAIENNLFDFFKEALEEGANPHQNIFSITYSQFYHIVTYITLFCDFKFIKFYLDHVLIDLINSKSYEPLNINIATTLRLKNNIYKTNILSPLSKGNFNKDIYKNYEYLKFFIEKNHIDVRYIK